MTTQLDTNKATGTIPAPPEGGGTTTALRSSKQKEEAQRRFSEMTDSGASELEIKQALGLSDGQYQACLLRWSRFNFVKKTKKASFPASCLPWEVRAIFDLASGDHLVLEAPDGNGNFKGAINKAASPDKSSIN